jgi:hypothetical protein
MSRKRRESSRSDRALADVGVAIAISSEFRFRVVEVEATQAVHAHTQLQLLDQSLCPGDRRIIKATRPQVLSVDAQAKSIVTIAGIDQKMDLLE